MTTVDVAALDLRVRGGLAEANRNTVDAQRALFDLFAVRGWRALGFDSWPAYLADAGAAEVQLPPLTEPRRALVAVMMGEGMTQQAMADELGVSQSVINGDVFTIIGPDNRDHVDPRKARKADLDARCSAYAAEHPEATQREIAEAVGCSHARVSQWAARVGHKTSRSRTKSKPRGRGRLPAAPSEEPLWTRSTELQDLRGLAVTVRAMKERNARIRIAQNITDAIEAGDQKFVEQHAHAAAEVAEYARELLAVFTDDAHRVDLNRGVPGRTDHNYRPTLKIASA